MVYAKTLAMLALLVSLGSALVALEVTHESGENPQDDTVALVARLWDREPIAIAATNDWLFGSDILWHRGDPVLVFGTNDVNHILSKSDNGEWNSIGGGGRGIVFSMNDQSLASLHRTREAFQFVRLLDSQLRRVGSNNITIPSTQADAFRYQLVEHAEFIDTTMYAFLSLSDGKTTQLLMLSSQDPETRWQLREVTELSSWIGSNLPVLVSDPDQIYLMTPEEKGIQMHFTQDGGHTWRQRTVQIQDDHQSSARLPVQLFHRQGALGLIYLSTQLPFNGEDKMRYYYTESVDNGATWKSGTLMTEFAPYEDEGVDYTDFTQIRDVMVFAHIAHGEDGEEGRVLLSDDGIRWVTAEVGKQFERAPDWISVSANEEGNRLVAATVLAKNGDGDDRLFVQELDLRE